TAAALLFASAWLGGSLAWRVVTVPDVGEPFDVAAYRQSLLADARDPHVQALRAVAEQFRHRWGDAEVRFGQRDQTVPVTDRGPAHLDFHEFVEDVLEHGYPAEPGPNQ